jgi:galactokinase
VGARDLYEISSPEMKHMMDAMMSAPGVVGARQAGAGFGGCMVAVVKESREEEFRKHVLKRYKELSSIEADVYPVEASAGAGEIKF